MIQAYVLINLSSQANKDEVVSILTQVDCVVEAHRVYGTHDLVVLLEAENIRQVKEITLESIRVLGEVHGTITLISLQSYHRN
jgi:DNA-binding Lrp family transcriptional regulator